MRNQAEVVTRVLMLGKGTGAMDPFGWQREVLYPSLDFKTASEADLLKEGVTEAKWDVDRGGEPTRESLMKDAAHYMVFAFDKAEHHRGLSASRSIDKLTSWLWLLELNLGRFQGTPYTPYGVPQLRVAAEELGVEFPRGVRFERMSKGEACRPNCNEGCTE